MVAEYRFLRFEIVGLATLFLYTVMLWPVAVAIIRKVILPNLSVALAGIAGLFLFAVPLGYLEHQLVVNRYRSEKKPRKIHGLVGQLIAEEAQKQSKTNPLEGLGSLNRNSILTTLTELFFFCKNTQFDPDIFDRISDRWSHFYARKAVGLYAPIISLVFWIATLVTGRVFGLSINLQNAWISLITWLVFSIPDFLLILPYSQKILSEINDLEVELIIMSEDCVRTILSKFVGSGYTSYLEIE